MIKKSKPFKKNKFLLRCPRCGFGVCSASSERACAKCGFGKMNLLDIKNE